MTIKAIKEHDWYTNPPRVLASVEEDGQDRIVWIPMAEVYVNPQARAEHEPRT